MRITGGPSRGRKIRRPGKAGNRDLRPPLVRMRKSIFSQLEATVPQSRILDLFAGTGSFGLEALSQGAREAVFVERDRSTAKVLEQNIRNLGFRHQSRVVVSDALSEWTLESLEDLPPFDVVFMDPPFRLFKTESEITRLKERLEAILHGPLLNVEGILVLRLPKRLDEVLCTSAAKTRVYGRSAVAFFDKTNDRKAGQNEE